MLNMILVLNVMPENNEKLVNLDLFFNCNVTTIFLSIPAIYPIPDPNNLLKF